MNEYLEVGMVRPNTPAEAGEKLVEDFNARVTLTLKELLEKKHLYQSVSLTFEDLIEAVSRSVVPSSSIAIIRSTFLSRMRTNWTIADPAVPRQVAATAGAAAAQAATSTRISFKTPDARLFCEICHRLEPFNSVATHVLISDPSRAIQAFALTFLCQGCKSTPEIFLVRRTGLKLTLCGRAPIEHIEVPLFIPTQIQPFYRGGILAYQSGQALAGNFMLRTVIEQWARLATNSETATDADKALDAYMKLLPNDFKDRFPSMRELYSDLSSDIHRAEGSSELFEKAQAQLVEHFDARRLLKIEPPTKPPAS